MKFFDLSDNWQRRGILSKGRWIPGILAFSLCSIFVWLLLPTTTLAAPRLTVVVTGSDADKAAFQRLLDKCRQESAVFQDLLDKINAPDVTINVVVGRAQPHVIIDRYEFNTQTLNLDHFDYFINPEIQNGQWVFPEGFPPWAATRCEMLTHALWEQYNAQKTGVVGFRPNHVSAIAKQNEFRREFGQDPVLSQTGETGMPQPDNTLPITGNFDYSGTHRMRITFVKELTTGVVTPTATTSTTTTLMASQPFFLEAYAFGRELSTWGLATGKQVAAPLSKEAPRGSCNDLSSIRCHRGLPPQFDDPYFNVNRARVQAEARSADLIIVGNVSALGANPGYWSGAMPATQNVTYSEEEILKGLSNEPFVTVPHLVVLGSRTAYADAPALSPILFGMGQQVIVMMQGVAGNYQGMDEDVSVIPYSEANEAALLALLQHELFLPLIYRP